MNNINGPSYGEPRETNMNPLSEEEIQAMEDDRLAMLEDAGIDESVVIAEIHKNRGNWIAFFDENNTKGKEDLEFYYRDQWTSIERSEFNRIFKPALVINKLYDPVRKIIGEQRENTPQIKVRSVTGKASQESIDLNSDMLKRIAYSSNSKVVYQQAFQSAMLYSYGAYMVDVDWQNSDSFYQDIMYRWMPEPEKCFWDARALECHKGDGNFCGYEISIGIEEYDARYPHAPHPMSFSDPSTMLHFQQDEIVVVCDYWVKEWYTKTILQLGTGEVVTEEEYEELKKTHAKTTKHLKRMLPEGMEEDAIAEFIEGQIPPILEVVNRRVTDDYRVMHYRCTADKVLEFEEWPSSMLPLIFVAGDTYYEQGQQYTRSFISQAKDAQRTVNYLASEIAGQLKNSSRGQWLGTPKNVTGPGMEFQWQNPETQQGILLANPDPSKGSNPMPERLPPAEIAQSLFVHYERATNDVKEVLGVYETAVGANGNENSGVAVMNRTLNSAGSAKIFFDNLNRAIEQGARVALDMFPAVYDDERTMTLTRANGSQYTVTINQEMEDGSMKNLVEKGDFDLELDAGPSFAMQKQQALELLISFMSAAGSNPNNPPVLPLIADKIAANMDLEFSQDIVERFKTLVPPEILAKEEGKEPPPPKPNPQEIMMQKQMQLADAKLQEQQHELQIREQKLALEQQKHELDKAQMLLKFQELQHKMRESEMRDATENNKAALNYSAEISKIIAQLRKEGLNFNNQSQ